ncbi:MAG TPA: hypothetical protein VEF34_03940, partial [Syntrophobacteraceae bacterium]|nr:hypothetical protein [Syntrophobacteraceae bacterium]
MNMGCLTLRPPVIHSFSPDEVKPSTGEPDAGDPLVRFGGRGSAIQCAIPTPISLISPQDHPWTPALDPGSNALPGLPG